MTILIRADASANIGGGHVVRTSSLGEALQKAGFKVVFATRVETYDTVPFLRECGFTLITLDCPSEDETSFLKASLKQKLDLTIVDHYERSDAYESNCRQFSSFIMAIDDAPNRLHDCDLLLDQNLKREPAEYKEMVPAGCKVLAGTKYALLRQQFSKKRKANGANLRARLDKILLMTGASDPLGVTQWVLNALCTIPDPLEIAVVGGALSSEKKIEFQVRARQHSLAFQENVSDMAALMSWADLAIGAAGSASWERCCLGLPALLFVIADNQLEICGQLETEGVAVNLGRFSEVTLDRFCKQVQVIIDGPAWLTSASKKAYNLCDGKGAERVAAAIDELLGRKQPRE